MGGAAWWELWTLPGPGGAGDQDARDMQALEIVMHEMDADLARQMKRRRKQKRPAAHDETDHE